MAIRRCPYCKAIIDEQDKYCNNCGTQLLFPEDEFVEEAIPGDKIIDEDESEEMEEKETTEEHELGAELEEEEELIDDEDDEEEEEKEEAEAEEDEEDEDEDEEEDEAEKDESDELEEEKEAGEEEGEPREVRLEAEAEKGKDADELEELARDEEIAAEAGTTEKEFGPDEEEAEDEEEELEGPDVSGTGKPAKSDKIYEVSIEEDELVVKTKDVPRRSEPVDEAIRARVRPPDTGSLPPWASRIRETPAIVEPEEEAQATKALSREWTTDSGIGIPERITQAALPYADSGGPGGPASGQERDHVDEESEIMTAEEGEAAPPGDLSLKLRAKLVDWVFVTALWLISLWFTAQVVGVSFFRLLFGSPLPVLAFYVILLGLYFFLFLYFLGETPGDHYFSE